MSENIERQTADLIDLTGEIFAAYVPNNSVRPSDLPDLIRDIHTALASLGNGTAGAVLENKVEKLSAAQIRKSITPDGIVSFLNGKSYKTMKRHLAGHGLDPHSYRQRFGLPNDYPMVSANYAARRSEVAKSMGLGRVADREEAA
jgi:predicted transcriptional regulator